MRCPHCSNPLAPQKPVCERCGFSDQALASYLGTEWIRLERLTDPAHCLRLEETRRLEIRLDDFERQFPQCFLALYFGALPAKLNPLELGMWILNHGAFSTHQFAKRNDFGAVCVIDPVGGTHGIALGYALEALLPANAIETLLATMVPHLRASHWSDAAELVINDLSALLRERGRVTRRRVEALPPPARSGSPGDYGFSPLRAGHRRAEAETPARRP